MNHYKVEYENGLMRIGFGPQPASNDQLVCEVETLLDELIQSGVLKGGPLLLRINGPASMPVLAVIIHKVVHLFGGIAIYDPKLQGYVVSISHSPSHRVGTVLPVSELSK